MARTLRSMLPALRARCALCRIVPGDPICAGCAADFIAADVPRCARCAIRVPPSADLCGACLSDPPAFDTTTALGDYAGPLAGMVSALKFRARIDLAQLFARLLARLAGCAGAAARTCCSKFPATPKALFPKRAARRPVR